MEASQIYIAISIVLLATVALIASFKSRDYKSKRLTPLAGIAFGFVLAGIIFGENRSMGYSLIGVGIILSLIDLSIKFRERRSEN